MRRPHPPQDILVYIDRSRPAVTQIELRRPPNGAHTQTLTKLRIRRQSGQYPGQGRTVAGTHQEAVHPMRNDLRRPAGTCSHHRSTGGHPFQYY